MHSHTSASELILTDLNDGCTLERIVSDLCAEFEMPAIFLDLNYHVILHSQITDPGRIWQYTITEGHLPDFIVSHINAEYTNRLFQMYRNNSLLELHLKSDKAYYLLILPIASLNTPEGTVSVQYRDVQDRDLALDIAEKLSMLYRYFSEMKNPGSPMRPDLARTYMARELLLYDDNKGNSIFNYALSDSGENGHVVSSMPLSPEYAIGAFRSFNTGASAERDFSLAAEETEGMIQGTFSLIHRGILYFFFSGLTKSMPEKDHVDAMSRCLSTIACKYHLYGGISSRFSELSDRHYYRRQAGSACHIGFQKDPEKVLYFADDLYRSIMVYEAAARCGKDILTLSEISRLKEYDAENDTFYFATLLAYLKNISHPAEAAEALYIDRGTLRYRIQKIRDLFNIRFDTNEQADQLLLAMECSEIKPDENIS